jgi:hypothetical protein
MLELRPPKPEPPPPADVSVVWADVEPVLDQGQTPHCIGFGGAQWGNTAPVDDKYVNDDGHAIYYECKVLDGTPGTEDGSYVRTLAKALKQRARLDAYAWAHSTKGITQYVRQSGPVIVGTDWYESMFEPNEDGTVVLDGEIAGGHCYLLLGHHPEFEMYEFLNSWGEQWGASGRFFMAVEDFGRLLRGDGEALMALELPLV